MAKVVPLALSLSANMTLGPTTFDAVKRNGVVSFTPSAPLGSHLMLLKLDSNASSHLYAIFKLHNLPYLVTKGDKVYLPFKLKNSKVGDELDLNHVTTLGSPEYTFNSDTGIDPSVFELKASIVEITREPLYQVYRTKQRCRRIKTFQVEPFQTVLMISELRLI